MHLARHFLIHIVWKPDTAQYLKMKCARLNTDAPADSVVQLFKGCGFFVGTVRDRLRDCPRDCSNGVGFCRDRRDCKLKG